MPLSLPTTINKPPDDISAYTILFAGPKKIGKTSLAAAAGKKPFIIQGEPKNSIALPVNQQDILSWLDFIEITSLLEKTPGYCDVKILDDVPSFYSLCFNYICKKQGFEHPQDLGYGKGWKFIENEFDQRIKKLLSLPGGMIYTAHTTIKDFENRHGKKFNRLETTMTGQADKLLDAIVQIWGVIEYAGENDQRVLTIRGSDFIKAGCGLTGRFLFPEGDMINQIPLGESPQEGWNNIVLAFNNQLPRTGINAMKTKTQVKGVSLPKSGLKIGKSGL